MGSSTEQNKAIAMRYSREIFSKGKLDLAEELIAEGYVNHNPIPGQVPGREGIKKSIAYLRSVFPDLEETIEDMIAEGDRVMLRTIRRGTHQMEFLGVPATGKQVSIPAMYVLRIQDGMVTDAWLNWDLLGLLQQLGAAPAPQTGTR
jgi:steroid delta-isomerase-like uncharacterized protein